MNLELILFALERRLKEICGDRWFAKFWAILKMLYLLEFELHTANVLAFWKSLESGNWSSIEWIWLSIKVLQGLNNITHTHSGSICWQLEFIVKLKLRYPSSLLCHDGINEELEFSFIQLKFMTRVLFYTTWVLMFFKRTSDFKMITTRVLIYTTRVFVFLKNFSFRLKITTRVVIYTTRVCLGKLKFLWIFKAFLFSVLHNNSSSI